ncbi:hypothetical protein ACOSQ2_032644 [Xanthoceras sorbifolium]
MQRHELRDSLRQKYRLLRPTLFYIFYSAFNFLLSSVFTYFYSFSLSLSLSLSFYIYKNIYISVFCALLCAIVFNLYHCLNLFLFRPKSNRNLSFLSYPEAVFG